MEELGHGGCDLIRRTYSHRGKFEHRGECVEVRLEQQHPDTPPDRLRLLEGSG